MAATVAVRRLWTDRIHTGPTPVDEPRPHRAGTCGRGRPRTAPGVRTDRARERRAARGRAWPPDSNIQGPTGTLGPAPYRDTPVPAAGSARSPHGPWASTGGRRGGGAVYAYGAGARVRGDVLAAGRPCGAWPPAQAVEWRGAVGGSRRWSRSLRRGVDAAGVPRGSPGGSREPLRLADAAASDGASAGRASAGGVPRPGSAGAGRCYGAVAPSRGVGGRCAVARRGRGARAESGSRRGALGVPVRMPAAPGGALGALPLRFVTVRHRRSGSWPYGATRPTITYSDQEGSDSGLLEAAALALGQPAPDSETLVIRKCVFKAF